MSRFTLSLSLLFLMHFTGSVEAGLFCERGGCKPACECEVVWGCCPKYEKENVTRNGFEVECEQICVPRVRLPWADPCEPRCAYVVCVNRMKKASKDMGEKCVLEWEAKPFCSRCQKPASGAYSGQSCAPRP